MVEAVGCLTEPFHHLRLPIRSCEGIGPRPCSEKAKGGERDELALARPSSSVKAAVERTSSTSIAPAERDLADALSHGRASTIDHGE